MHFLLSQRNSEHGDYRRFINIIIDYGDLGRAHCRM